MPIALQCRKTSPLDYSLAGVMNLVQMSRSLSVFLSSPGIYDNTSQLKALAEQDTPFLLGNHPPSSGECTY